MVIRKQTGRILAVLLALVLILAAAAAYLLWRELRDDSRDRVSFALTVKSGDEILWKNGKSEAVPAGTDKITLLWKEKMNATVRLLSGGAFLGQATLAPGEERTLAVAVEEEAPLTVILLPEKGAATAFAADARDLAFALDYLVNGGDLVCLSPMDLGELTLSAPLRLFGDFTFSSLTVDTEKAGRLVIAPDSAFSAPVLVYAPNCPATFYRFTPAHDRELDAYYLRVPTLNRRACFTGAVPVASETELSRLFDETVLPRLVPGDTVSVARPVTLRRDLSFSGLLSFDLQASLTGNAAICVATLEEGEMSVALADGASASPALFELDVPNARLNWSAAVPPALTVVERLWNVKSYNGEAPALGGTGAAVPVLTLSQTEGILPEDVRFVPAGNTLVGTLPYNVTEEDLEEVPFTLSAEGGRANLEGSVIRHTGLVTVTDTSGATRRYAILFVRQAKNIPAVYLETDGREEIASRTRYVSGLFAMDPGKSGCDGADLTHVRVRGRGNSTWKWDKKPYKLHFDQPVSLFGLPAAEEWALLANYADKSLMRNHLALVMASALSFDYTPTQVLVDVFLNGEYQGVYSLGEHLETGAGRVEVRHDRQAKDCGFFLEAGGVVSGVDVKGMNYFHAGLLKFVLIKDPDYNDLTTVQFNYIRDYLLALDKAIKEGSGWEDYVDIDSLVDWMIMTELSFNTDCAWRRSTYLVKNPGEKVKMATVWDFDLAFGNFSKDVQSCDTWVSTNPDDSYVGTTWSTYLLEDPVFQKAFKARWNEVRDSLLQLALEEIDRTYEQVLPSAEENFVRWQILGRKVAFERKDTVNYPTYDSQIEYLKNYLTRRAAWIDRAVADWA